MDVARTPSTPDGNPEMADAAREPKAPLLIRREDYSPFPWLVPEVSLDFELGVQRTRVRASCVPDAAAGSRRLRAGASLEPRWHSTSSSFTGPSAVHFTYSPDLFGAIALAGGGGGVDGGDVAAVAVVVRVRVRVLWWCQVVWSQKIAVVVAWL